MNIFTAPFINALFGFYYLVGNLGWSIIIVTILIRLLLLPLLFPSLKSAKKMRDLQPKLNKLKEKFGKDKQKMAQAQMELYKQEGINPLSGCLPQILQIAVLLLFFSAFNTVTSFSQGQVGLENINQQLVRSFQINEGFRFELDFFGTNLVETPSKIFQNGMGINLLLPIILLLGSGVLQFFSAKMMMPNPKADENVVKATKDKEDDMMGIMRTQSTYLMPLMTIFIGWSFSIGILLYWFVNSLVMFLQQVATEKLGVKGK